MASINELNKFFEDLYAIKFESAVVIEKEAEQIKRILSGILTQNDFKNKLHAFLAKDNGEKQDSSKRSMSFPHTPKMILQVAVFANTISSNLDGTDQSKESAKSKALEKFLILYLDLFSIVCKLLYEWKTDFSTCSAEEKISTSEFTEIIHDFNASCITLFSKVISSTTDASSDPTQYIIYAKHCLAWSYYLIILVGAHKTDFVDNEESILQIAIKHCTKLYSLFNPCPSTHFKKETITNILHAVFTLMNSSTTYAQPTNRLSLLEVYLPLYSLILSDTAVCTPETLDMVIGKLTAFQEYASMFASTKLLLTEQVTRTVDNAMILVAKRTISLATSSSFRSKPLLVLRYPMLLLPWCFTLHTHEESLDGTAAAEVLTLLQQIFLTYQSYFVVIMKQSQVTQQDTDYAMHWIRFLYDVGWIRNAMEWLIRSKSPVLKDVYFATISLYVSKVPDAWPSAMAIINELYELIAKAKEVRLLKIVHRIVAQYTEYGHKIIQKGGGGGNGHDRSSILLTLSKFSLYTNNKWLLLLYTDATTGLLSLLIHFLQPNLLDAYEFSLLIGNLWNVAELGGKACAKIFLSNKASKWLMYYMQVAGSDSKLWTESTLNTMNCIMNLSRDDDMQTAFIADGAIEAFAAIYEHSNNLTTVHRMKAMVILAFLVGDREQTTISSSTTKTIICFDQLVVNEIVDILNNNLLDRGTKCYPRGTFGFPVTVHACLVISKSDTNKPLLIEAHIFRIIAMLLRKTVEGVDVISPLIGGGRSDEETNKLAIDLLFTLSFAYTNDDELQERMFQEDTAYVEILTKVQSIEYLTTQSIKRVNHLLERLLNKKGGDCNIISEKIALLPTAVTHEQSIDGSTAITTTSTVNNKHVMLSYAWNESANPTLVKALGKELYSLGIDVWRDEVGSSIVPPMSGSVDERMAEAIQASDLVVICVSSAYKKSSNCRLESSYASVLNKRGKVKLVFVMMNVNYTTVSDPEYIDGWLGILVGGALWIPLWEESHIALAAKFIAEQADVSTRLSATRQVPSNVLIEQQILSDQANDNGDEVVELDQRNALVSSQKTREQVLLGQLDEAWKILHSDGTTKDTIALTGYLEEVGLVYCDLLKYCSDDVVVRISQYLKAVPQQAFIVLMNRIREHSTNSTI